MIAVKRQSLIVDNSQVYQMGLKATLNRLGLKTLKDSNGEEALTLLGEQPVDIILMDCQMPVMDGFAATRAIRALDNDRALIPIIAITANAMSKDRNRCVEAGMNDYMSKPVDTHELKEKLLKWLPLRPSATVISLAAKRDRHS